MVIDFCGFRRRARARARPNVSSESGGVVDKLMAAMKVKRRRLSLPEKKQLCVDDGCKVVRATTLEELIAASPGAAGETPMHKQSSRRIHPSTFDGDLEQSVLPISIELTANVESLSRTRSGKPMKKVTFRSPEVADVFEIVATTYMHVQMDSEINSLTTTY